MATLPEALCNNGEGHGRAATYCEHCKALLCENCRKSHDETEAFTKHRLIPLTRGKEPIRYILCQKHQIYFNYFCKECGKAMCRVCASDNHAHHNTITLHDFAQSKKTQLNDVISQLTKMAADMNERKEEPGKMEEEARSMIDKAEDDFNMHLDQCRQALTEWEASMKRDIAGSKAGLKRDVERILTERREFLLHVKKLEDQVRQLLLLDRPMEVVEKTGLVEQELEKVRSELAAVNNNTYVNAAKLTSIKPPKSYGQVKAVGVGPASDRSKMTFWAKVSRGSGVGELLSPCDVLLLPDGELILADWGNSRIQRFLSSGEMATVILEDVTPERLAFTPDGHLAVTDDKTRMVVIISLENGEVIRSWQPDGLSRPWALTVTQDGSWVITDVTSSRCHLYSPDGVLVRQIAGRGEEWDIQPGDLDLPSYVFCDLLGRILVSDCNKHCVNVYSEDGDFILRVGERGDQDGQLLYPRGVCVDEVNNILVADWGNDRISLFSSHGDFIKQVISKDDMAEFGWPYGITFLSGTLADSKARLAVAGEGPDALIVIPYHHPTQHHENDSAQITDQTTSDTTIPSTQDSQDTITSQQAQHGTPTQHGTPPPHAQHGTPTKQVQHGTSTQRQNVTLTQQRQNYIATQQRQNEGPAQQRHNGILTQERQSITPTQQRQTGIPTQQRQTGIPTQQRQNGISAQERQSVMASRQQSTGSAAVPSGSPDHFTQHRARPGKISFTTHNSSSPEDQLKFQKLQQINDPAVTGERGRRKSYPGKSMNEEMTTSPGQRSPNMITSRTIPDLHQQTNRRSVSYGSNSTRSIQGQGQDEGQRGQTSGGESARSRDRLGLNLEGVQTLDKNENRPRTARSARSTQESRANLPELKTGQKTRREIPVNEGKSGTMTNMYRSKNVSLNNGAGEAGEEWKTGEEEGRGMGSPGSRRGSKKGRGIDPGEQRAILGALKESGSHEGSKRGHNMDNQRSSKRSVEGEGQSRRKSRTRSGSSTNVPTNLAQIDTNLAQIPTNLAQSPTKPAQPPTTPSPPTNLSSPETPPEDLSSGESPGSVTAYVPSAGTSLRNRELLQKRESQNRRELRGNREQLQNQKRDSPNTGDAQANREHPDEKESPKRRDPWGNREL